MNRSVYWGQSQTDVLDVQHSFVGPFRVFTPALFSAAELNSGLSMVSLVWFVWAGLYTAVALRRRPKQPLTSIQPKSAGFC